MKIHKTKDDVQRYLLMGEVGTKLCYYSGPTFSYINELTEDVANFYKVNCAEIKRQASELQSLLETLHDRRDIVFFQQLVERKHGVGTFKYYIKRVA